MEDIKIKYSEYIKDIDSNVYDEADFRAYLVAIENDAEISDLQYENLLHFLISVYYDRMGSKEIQKQWKYLQRLY